jgi:hypothetical protein
MDAMLDSKTDPKEQRLLSIAHSLPEEFNFYHLGEVKQQTKTSSSSNPLPSLDLTHTAIAFQVYGDLQAWVMLVVGNELDSSLYAELGNILVSQFVTHLHSTQGIGVMVSPPHFLTSSQANQLLFHSHHQFHKTYLHHLSHSEHSTSTLSLPIPTEVPIETWILLSTQEEGGHA